MRRPKPTLRRLACLALAAGLAGAALPAGAQDFQRDALRHVVAACALSHGTIGLAFPCTEVKAATPQADGYVLLHSPGLRSELLLVPIAPVDGIESPALHRPAARALWVAAWEARSRVAEALGKPLAPTATGLAVNSRGARSQDQFHIHIDCLRPGVEKALAAKGRMLGPKWRLFPGPLAGTAYWARLLPADLGTVDVTALVVDGLPGAAGAMEHLSVALAPVAGPKGPGIALLANTADNAAEALLDHSCKGR